VQGKLTVRAARFYSRNFRSELTAAVTACRDENVLQNIFYLSDILYLISFNTKIQSRARHNYAKSSLALSVIHGRLSLSEFLESESRITGPARLSHGDASRFTLGLHARAGDVIPF